MTRSAMGGVFRLTDEMWAKFEPLIPPRVNTHKFGGGRYLPRASVRARRPTTASNSGYARACSADSGRRACWRTTGSRGWTGRGCRWTGR